MSLFPRREAERRSIAQSNLPVEIFEEVLRDLVPPSGLAHAADHEDGRCHDRLHWYTVLHVCRGWRTAAHGCTDFWTFLPLWDAIWTRRALALSSPKHVTIDTDVGKHHPSLVSIGAPSHAFVHAVSRAREIVVAFSPNCDVDFHLQTLRAPQSAPWLEVLRLDSRNAPYPREYSRLPCIFNAEPPRRLRKLQLLSVSFTNDTAHSLFVASLTHLEIDHFDQFYPEYEGFAGLVNLEYLSLASQGRLPWFPTSSEYPRKLRADRLRTIKLDGYISSVKQILRTIEARSCEDMTLEINTEHDDHDQPTQGMVDRDGDPVPSLTECILSSLCVDSDGPNRAVRRLYFTSEMNYFPSTYAEATNLFRNVPNLTDLTVINDNPVCWLPEPAEGAFYPVYMPHLRRLHVSSNYEEVFRAVAECVLIPEGAEYHVHVERGPFLEMPADRYCRKLRRILWAPTRRPHGVQHSESPDEEGAVYTTLELTKPDDGHGLVVTASHPKGDQLSSSHTLKLTISFYSVEWYFDNESCRGALRHIDSIIPQLSSYDSLDINVDHPYFEENPALFGRCMHVDDVEVPKDGRSGNEYCVAVIRSALAKARKVGYGPSTPPDSRPEPQPMAYAELRARQLSALMTTLMSTSSSS